MKTISPMARAAAARAKFGGKKEPEPPSSLGYVKTKAKEVDEWVSLGCGSWDYQKNRPLAMDQLGGDSTALNGRLRSRRQPRRRDPRRETGSGGALAPRRGRLIDPAFRGSLEREKRTAEGGHGDNGRSTTLEVAGKAVLPTHLQNSALEQNLAEGKDTIVSEDDAVSASIPVGLVEENADDGRDKEMITGEISLDQPYVDEYPDIAACISFAEDDYTVTIPVDNDDDSGIHYDNSAYEYPEAKIEARKDNDIGMSDDETMRRSPHVGYESQNVLRRQEVELGESTHLLSRDQDAGNFNSSMGNDTGELDLQNESVTTDPLLGDVRFDPVATPEQHQFNGS